jgi:hypothetical protein
VVCSPEKRLPTQWYVFGDTLIPELVTFVYAPLKVEVQVEELKKIIADLKAALQTAKDKQTAAEEESWRRIWMSLRPTKKERLMSSRHFHATLFYN